jgi:hypothetical protein
VVDTLMPETFTPGATPVMPTPFLAAAISPATCVPCGLPDSLGRHAPSVVSGLPVTQLTDASRSKFGAMSGCVSSTPVSITATVTLLLPSDFSCALSALMAGRSHCIGSSGSWPGAAFALATSLAVSAFGVPRSVVDCAGSGALRVLPADSTPRTLRRVLAKSGFDEWTTITPIWSYDVTIVPPASAMAFFTCPEGPCPGRTLTT